MNKTAWKALLGLLGVWVFCTHARADRSGYIKVDQGALYYEECGRGEPVILIHGHSLDCRMWDEQFKPLARHFRVIRYDLRGYGRSTSQTEHFQFTHVQDLVALMDSLRIEKAHVVGLSLGGYVGADMLGWFPDRMKSAFLASGNVRQSKGPSEPMTKEEAAVRDREIAELKIKGVDVMKREWFEGLVNSGGTRRERMRKPLWKMIDEWDAWQPLHKEVRVVAGIDAYRKLKENKPEVPVLIVEGNAPHNKFPAHPEILDYLPNGDMMVLPDCGHMMNMERPDEFYRTLKAFIDKVDEFTPLDTMIQSWVGKGYYPGAAICVKRDTSVLFRRNYGNVNGDTPVYVASSGKWVAAAVIAAVVDRTDLTWDDEVEKWLPEFKGDPKGKIRLRRLLSHTSGIRPYLPEPRVDNYNSLDSAVAEILPLDTVFASGARFEYGGLAMQVAGRMAEVAYGKDFETLFQELIARPLNMTRSHFTPINTDGGHSPMLGGGLCTTLNDYMNFLDMIIHQGIFNGYRVLNPETIKEMQADQVRGAKIAPDDYVERALGLHHNGVYGLGEWRELVDEKTGEAYRITSPGWAGAYPWIDLREGVYGFFIAHVVGGSSKPDGFSSFYGSHVMADVVSEIIAKKR